MDIIRKMLLDMDSKSPYDVYLREIVLSMEEKEALMEEIDTLKGKLKERDKLIKFYELERKGKKYE